jgi:hypothetical protein
MTSHRDVHLRVTVNDGNGVTVGFGFTGCGQLQSSEQIPELAEGFLILKIGYCRNCPLNQVSLRA